MSYLIERKFIDEENEYVFVYKVYAHTSTLRTEKYVLFRHFLENI